MDPIKTLQAAVSNPLVRDTVGRGLEVRDAVLRAQTAMLATLNLPSAEDLATVSTHLRSISQRLELLEDAVTDLDSHIAHLRKEVRAIADGGPD